MQLERIHHVAIICSDYEVSKHFYTQVLGFKVIAETYRREKQSHRLDLKMENGDQLELFTFPDSPVRVTQPEALGLRHLAFEVKNVDEAVRDLTLKGIDPEPIKVDPVTGRKYTFFCDPDKLPIELYESTSV